MSYAKEIRDRLRRLGVHGGGNLLVHTSLKSLGPLPGGAEDVITGLMESLGPSGTLLLPALSYRTVNRENPVFDLANTPACVGALPEYFRTRPGTRRSIHPTHSVCGIGPGANLLLGEHQLDTTPCGKHSPYYRLNEQGGQILFIGCGLNPNTSMHAVEELIEPEYLFSDYVDYRIILPQNKEMRMRVNAHNFKGWEHPYERLASLMDDESMKRGRVLEADCYLLEVGAMWERAYEAMIADPLYFVKRVETSPKES